MSTPIEKVTGIGPQTAALLAGHGILSAEDLAAGRVGDLAVIKGFSAVRAEQVIAAAKQLIGVAIAVGSEEDVPAAKKDKVKKDKKKKKNKDSKKKSAKSEKKKSSTKKGKDKKGSDESGKKGKKKKK